MANVSIIIPSRNEPFLNKTVLDLLAKASGEIEILVVLDGYYPDPPLVDDPRVILIHHGDAQGMRPGINGAVRLARGPYLLKIDAHCLVGEGYDTILQADCADDWIVVPRRQSLDAENWCLLNTGKSPVDAHFLSYPFEAGRAGVGLHGSVWTERARTRKDVLIDDEMSSQGSCWFMTRTHWDRLGEMESKKYGNFVQESQELMNKTWLGGGRVVINKKTSYFHWHKGASHGRGYWISKKEMSDGAKFCVEYWMNDQWPERVHDMRWLIEKFWPVPGWPAQPDGSPDWDRIKRETAEFSARYAAGDKTLQP